MSELLTPPQIPTAILHFFANQPDFSVLLGDMSEEFQQRARQSGARAAELWFWREAVRNALALTFRELMQAPVRIAAIALGCVAAVNLTTGLGELLFVHSKNLYPTPDLSSCQEATCAFLWNLRFRVSPHSGWGILAAIQLFTCVIVGRAGAKLAVGREWALALIFPLFSMSWTAVGVRALLAAHIGAAFVGHLPRVGAFWLGSLWIRQSREKVEAL